MNRLSKFPLFGQFSRNIHVTRSLRDIPSDPVKELTDFCSEKHAKPLLPIINFMLWVVIPLCSIKLWYDEYQHKVVHRQRMPWPKHDWLNSQQRPFPWGDGERSALFHPYWNFTKNGYVTDKDGNPLPKGVYADE